MLKKEINNFKLIREIYGATQDEIAKAINVNRATISNWETGANKASSASLEKLSLFYGIGPECFYEIEIDDVRREMLIANANKAREIEEQSGGKRNKAEDFQKTFLNITFDKAIQKYMLSMKMLLATADSGTLDNLKTAYQINQKMGNRLQAIVNLREIEEKAKQENNEQTLFDLMKSLTGQEE